MMANRSSSLGIESDPDWPELMLAGQ